MQNENSMSGSAPPPPPPLQSFIRFPNPNVVIGRGAFGEVSEAFDTSSGRVVAVKHLSLKEADGTNISRDKVANLVAEVGVMKKLNHTNIVKYIGAYRNEDSLNIVMEYIAAGSVARLINRYGRLPEPVVRVYARDTVRGLAYLHQNKVAHRDVKCENLLLCSTGVVKLSDFGSSKEMVDETASTVTGTPLFMAPEVALNKGGYDAFLADVWTVGITVIQMLEGEPPLAGRFRRPLEAILHVAQSEDLPPTPAGVSENCASFLSKCIVRDPTARWTAEQLLSHPFIAVQEDEPPRYPEPPGSANFRAINRPSSGRPSSGTSTRLSVPRPPSSQRLSPGGGDVGMETLSARSPRPGSSGNVFPGRLVADKPASRPTSRENGSYVAGSRGNNGSISVRGAVAPKPHHLPSLVDDAEEADALPLPPSSEPRPPSAERAPSSSRRPVPGG